MLTTVKMADSCVVCLDPFNKTIRAPTECSYCHTKICRTCLQTYLLNEISDIPRCVNTDCRQGWGREFLDSEFTRSFRLTTYKEHREKILADREKARLPSTQQDAANYKVALQIQNETTAELEVLKKEENRIQRRMWEVEGRQRRAKLAYETHGRVPIVSAESSRAGAAAGAGAAGAAAVEPAKTHAVFIKPCPATDCKGFLSSAWKCGLCDLWSCPDCHELKGPVRDCEHTCDAEKVASARLIAREAKSCPKCGVQICKIEGCDQMFCTVCNTGFNWRTGKIAEGPVHNPHYFDWLRRQGRDPAATAAAPPLTCDQDLDRRITQALGGANTNYYYGYRYRPRNARPPADTDDNYLLEAWRIMREVQDNERHEPNPEEQFRALRVQFMVGEMKEDEWKVALQRLEKDMNFSSAKQQVRELFVGACRDLIRLLLEPNPNKSDIRRQVVELIQYCNTSYEAISKRFGRKTPVIKINIGADAVAVAAPVAAPVAAAPVTAITTA